MLVNGDSVSVTEEQVGEHIVEGGSPSGYRFRSAKVSPDNEWLLIPTGVVGENYGRRADFFVTVVSSVGEVVTAYEVPFEFPCIGFDLGAHVGWTMAEDEPAVLVSFPPLRVIDNDLRQFLPEEFRRDCPSLILLRTDGSMVWELVTEVQSPQFLVDPEFMWIAFGNSRDGEPLEVVSVEDPERKYSIGRESQLPEGLRSVSEADILTNWTPLDDF